jgi:hypothetical protein
MTTFSEIVDLITAIGPVAGLLAVAAIFFLWRDYRREDRLTTRVASLETDFREVLLPLVRTSSAVIERNTAVMERLERHLDR